MLKVTGRDVAEAEYAAQITDGSWTLMGDDLAAAASTAVTLRATANLSDRSGEVLRFVAKHPAGVRAGDVAKSSTCRRRRPVSGQPSGSVAASDESLLSLLET